MKDFLDQKNAKMLSRDKLKEALLELKEQSNVPLPTERELENKSVAECYFMPKNKSERPSSNSKYETHDFDF